ncbi:MAG: pyridoxamine 5'-phosphate oxidase family protein [Armatimonadota bacterium]|nr:MAG: pyridoxamine 5'-phosphate oxidase family protein [Armatimonadota bacterium]
MSEAIEFLMKHPETYLATVDNGAPWVRAMQIARIDDEGSIWYATALSSSKVGQVRRNPRVCLAVWADGRQCRVFGSAELITDAAVKHQLWDDSWRTYFRAEEDPEYVLLKVVPERAELS